MFIDPDLLLLIPDPGPRSEMDIFDSMEAYRRSIAEWRDLLSLSDASFREFMQMTFGSDPTILQRRAALYLRALECACASLDSQTQVWLVGCPSRINWEGHHVDHQGGWYNATTDESEMTAVVAPRTDAVVHIRNTNSQFPEISFSPADREPVGKGKTIWADYVKGAFLSVLDRFPGIEPKGADLFVAGDIPIGTGQSSSHALCVVSVLAAVAVNGLRLTKRKAVICAQEAEWFAGSRTGLGDQTTMIFGRRNRIMASPVIEENTIAPTCVSFPPHYIPVIVDSFTSHQLQGAQSIGYSGRVFAYRIAFPFVLNALLEVGADAQTVARTRYLADIHPDRFLPELIYRALLRLPCSIRFTEIEMHIDRIQNSLKRIGRDIDIDVRSLRETYFGNRPCPASIDLRGVALYGLSECRRSTRWARLLAEGRYDEAARLVNLGHDGDRIIEKDSRGNYAPKRHDISDEYLRNLIADLRSGDEQRVRNAQLEYQTGAYGAGHPLLDRIVDVCRENGAACASLTGAGLGGVVTVLVEQDRFESLKRSLIQFYRAEQERSLSECAAQWFCETAGKDAAGLREQLTELWARKCRALDSSTPWEPTEKDREFTGHLISLADNAAVSPERLPSFHLFLVDETTQAVRRNHSVDGAGFLHPPARPSDHKELWEQRTAAELRSQENAAFRDKNWEKLERHALQQRNVACRRIRLRRNALPDSDTGETFLVTGGAGFIGSHLAKRLLEEGHRVIVLDDFNSYYNPFLKYENIRPMLDHPAFELIEGDFRDLSLLERIFLSRRIDQIVHLGARAGVRPSIQDPPLYVTTNILGTQNLLEMARRFSVKNFVYASSSSVYGGSEQYPFTETQPVDHPVSPYAAGKKANELQASCYHRLYGFPVTGLRFFTVYGPGGRPDMAVRKFIESLGQGKPAPLYGDGSFKRDYTYIDDIIDGILQAIRASAGRENWNEIINLGECDTTSVRELILLIADSLGVIHLESDPKELPDEEISSLIQELQSRGLVEILPEQLGDVPLTCADISKAEQLIGYRPKTKIAEGIRKTVQWHREAESRSPHLESWSEAVRAWILLSERAGLDSLGCEKDPLYSEKDLQELLQIRDRVEHLLALDRTRKTLGLRLLYGIYCVLGEMAAYLHSDDERPWGMTGLLVHRRRMEILDRIHAAAGRSITAEEESKILELAGEIVQICGEREAAVVVAAAGLGTRIAKEVGGYGQKHRLFFGDNMLLLSLRNMTPYAKRVVVIVGAENRDEIAESLQRSEINEDHGFSVEYVIQAERLGDGDAHLTASRALRGYRGIVLFIFADAPTKSAQTISKMVRLKQALGSLVPLVIPTLIRDNPYAPILVAPDGPDRGHVLWNWQKADENLFDQARKARAGRGLLNVGIFAGEPEVFAFLQELKDGYFCRSEPYKTWLDKMAEWEKQGRKQNNRPRPPEFGFADLVKILSSRGIAIAAPSLAIERDRLNVNNPEGADQVREIYRRLYPQVRVEIERREAVGEVVIRLLDLNAEGQVIDVNGIPSYRNYTRLQFGRDADLSSPEVENAVRDHIRSLAERIEREMGIGVVWE
ncbi:MAG TPA: GDP-mannose 4,6-dehydratase [bacterium]|nr:GDP-mannose 4,6-dehydratase [bacterium]